MVAIGTLALAGYTARLASKTSALADQTKEEVRHSADLATKAQQQVDAANAALVEAQAQTRIAQRTLDAQYRPVLIGVGAHDRLSTDIFYPGAPTAAQARDNEIVVSVADNDARVSVPLRNVGPGPALITEATVDIGTQDLGAPVAFQFATVPPGENARVNVRAWEGTAAFSPLSEFLRRGQGFAVIVEYADIGGRQRTTSSFKLERAATGWRLKNVVHVGADNEVATSADFVSNV